MRVVSLPHDGITVLCMVPLLLLPIQMPLKGLWPRLPPGSWARIPRLVAVQGKAMHM